ncbi:iron-sulfur cluster carrier protein ApbC [Methylogaea oryzae]|uniref:Iron-sulfur cluster carrier protein n=1 Tax=Methylogaea oryzae TaxID=1295382 RepID=A0A8D5AL30_9GAMM|nr:iron-sulfur cluster carrier protein ApbC [Methylogaea oryzae]BBL69750.1 iron-sulfur cluster carrier protein [Methylogaea oryzae]
MSQISQTDIETVLQAHIDPYTGQDLMASKAVKGIAVDDGKVSIHLVLGYPAAGYRERLATELRDKIAAATGATAVELKVETKIVSHAVQKNLKPLQGVKNIIAVASGKGGVGKSTTAVNLALALAAEGARVGMLDADIYGPSQPQMLGLSGTLESPDGKNMLPKEAFGIKANSIGLLIDEDTPMIWRGPMVTGALQQLLNNTLWGELDYLVIDLPPGTGDIQLTLCQQIPVSGALIVTTPQDIALLDAQKGLKMFEKVEVAVLGVVENMSVHICSHCGHAEHIFGAGGGEKMAHKYGVELLGALPLDVKIRENADGGHPTVVAEPDGAAAQMYREIARKTAGRLAMRAKDFSARFPTIIVENN